MNILTSNSKAVNFAFLGVPVSPLGISVDSIEFTQRLDRSGSPFGLWLEDNNIYVNRWNYYGHSLLTVNVYSLPKFCKGRSSSVITDYFAALRRLNDTINDAPTMTANGIQFDAFKS